MVRPGNTAGRDQDPEVLIQRSIAAATVYDALSAACEYDVELCEQVRHYLRGYMKEGGIGQRSVTIRYCNVSKCEDSVGSGCN